MIGCRQQAGQPLAQLIDAVACRCGDSDGLRIAGEQAGEHIRVGEIGLVEDDELGDVIGVSLGEHFAHGCQLTVRVRVSGVDDVHEHIGERRLLQCGAEGFDELMRQIAHEPDGVGERELTAVLGRRLPHRGIQGGEELVADHDIGVGEPVEQGGLPGVGVADDRYGRDLMALPVGALRLPCRGHIGDLAAQLGHPGADAAAVEFDLRLTGTAGADALTAGDPATGLTGHRLAPAAQARQEVFELGEFDLGFALAALGVLGEDVEDERDPVDNLDLDDILQPAPLAGRQLGVDDDGVSADGGDDVGQFLSFAAAQVGARVRVVAALQHAVEHSRAGRLGKRGELTQRFLRLGGGSAGPDPGEHDLLQA